MAMTTTSAPVSTLSLLLLGAATDLNSERGVDCPGTLPPASDPDLVERAGAARATLGDSVFILGHHYQRDEVMEFADATGDSFKLARTAAAHPDVANIVFCGVHFMAESADILTGPDQRVLLPDLAAGCSMADMASGPQVDAAWETLSRLGLADSTVPVTYMNSSAAIKSFTGRNGGAVCTSSNAAAVLNWAFERGERVLFLPDEHLGRNTAVRDLGIDLSECALYDPRLPDGGLTPDALRSARMLLWRGHCSVHARFSTAAVAEVRERIPGVSVLVHPECQYEVVQAADLVGSTEFIIATLDAAPTGSAWAIGTELNLVRRLATAHPNKQVTFLDRTVCYCSTMNRIDLPHLVWTLESLVAGRAVNQIQVDATTAKWARVALDRMLALPGPTATD
jgi:quinolinate synthase